MTSEMVAGRNNERELLPGEARELKVFALRGKEELSEGGKRRRADRSLMFRLGEIENSLGINGSSDLVAKYLHGGPGISIKVNLRGEFPSDPLPSIGKQNFLPG